MRKYKHRQDARLSEKQVRAAYVLYQQGLSLRALGALLYEKHGYSSAKSCANSLHDLFKGHGLKMRDKNKLMAERNYKHGRGARKDKASYKRWHRQTYGPWPSDMA